MRLSTLYPAGLVLAAAVHLGWPAFPPAAAQPPSAPIEDATARPKPSEALPADFIDSRPIVAYFDAKIMPDTVRGLLEELKRPDRCGASADLRAGFACALVLYRLSDQFTPDRTRPPFILKAIYRVSDAADPADTVITMPDAKGVLQRYANGDLYEPLRNVRANICLQKKGVEQCKATTSKGVLYLPYAILGKVENDRENILPVQSAGKHFAVQAESVETAEWLKAMQMLNICRLQKNCQ